MKTRVEKKVRDKRTKKKEWAKKARGRYKALLNELRGVGSLACLGPKTWPMTVEEAG